MRNQSSTSVQRSPLLQACKSCVLPLVLVLLTLSGCDSGSSDSGGGVPPPPPPPPPPAGIGPAGGTVTGSNGATIVVPAGALATTVDLKITEIAAGTANLPAGIERVSAVYALTPHGTTFTMPVTITLPFDSAQVPAGRNVQLSKTSDVARTVWEVVAGATVSGTTISGATSSFSDTLVSQIPTLPTITTQPANQAVDIGQSASFSVVAEQNGGAFLFYQWQKDGVDIPGATTASYTLASATSGDNGAQFTVIVSNGIGDTSSQPATLTVNAATGWTPIGGAVFTETINGVVTPVRYPSVAVAPDGTVYVAYGIRSSGLAGLVGALRVSRWNGTSWAQLGDDLNDDAGDPNAMPPITYTAPEWPSIKVGSDGVPVVAWVNRALDGISINEVVVQSWDATSLTWQRLVGDTPSGIWGGATQATAPQLVLGAGSNQPNVVFGESICVVYRTLVGSVWEPDRQRACAASNQSSAALALDNSGTALVAGSPATLPLDGNGNPTDLRNWIAVRYRGAQDDGYFSSELGGGPANSVKVDEIQAAGLSAASSGDVFLAFVSRNSGSAAEMTVRKWNGTTWTTLGGNLLASDPLFNTSPYLQIENAVGIPGIAWTTGTSVDLEITGSVWNGTSWDRVPAPHDASANIGHFDVTVGPDNMPYVAYTIRNPSQAQAGTALGYALYVSKCDNWCVAP